MSIKSGCLKLALKFTYVKTYPLNTYITHVAIEWCHLSSRSRWGADIFILAVTVDVRQSVVQRVGPTECWVHVLLPLLLFQGLSSIQPAATERTMAHTRLTCQWSPRCTWAWLGGPVTTEHIMYSDLVALYPHNTLYTVTVWHCIHIHNILHN